MQKKKGSTTFYTALFFIILFLIVAILLTAWWKSPGIQEMKDISIHLEVSDHVSISNRSDILSFGTTTPTSISSRNISVKNPRKIPASVLLTVSGQIKNWVYTSDNNFTLGPLESRHVTVYVKVPENTSYGNYTAKLHVKLKTS